MELQITQKGPDALIPVRVQPKSSRNGHCVGPDGKLRVSITAPPVDGEANKAVVKYLADALGVAKSRVTLVAGEKGREKTLAVAGCSAAEAAAKLSPPAHTPDGRE